MNLNEYQNLLENLQCLKLEYAEIHYKILSSGYPSMALSDMPKGGNYDSVDNLIDLIDTEIIIMAEINVLQARIQRSKRQLDKYIKEIECPQKRLVIRLKYVNNLTPNEIAEETGKSYWSVIKVLKRY